MRVGCGRRAEKILSGPSGPVSSRTSRHRCRSDRSRDDPTGRGCTYLSGVAGRVRVVHCAAPVGCLQLLNRLELHRLAHCPSFLCRHGRSAIRGQLHVFRLGSLLCRWLGWGSLKPSEFVGVGARPVKTSHGGDESNGRSLRVDARRLSSLSTTFDKGRRRTRHCQRSPRSPDRRMGIGSWDGRCGWAHAVWVPRRALLMRCR